MKDALLRLAPAKHVSPQRTAVRISLGYGLASILWILFSDRALESVAWDSH